MARGRECVIPRCRPDRQKVGGRNAQTLLPVAVQRGIIGFFGPSKTSGVARIGGDAIAFRRGCFSDVPRPGWCGCGCLVEIIYSKFFFDSQDALWVVMVVQ